MSLLSDILKTGVKAAKGFGGKAKGVWTSARESMEASKRSFNSFKATEEVATASTSRDALSAAERMNKAKQWWDKSSMKKVYTGGGKALGYVAKARTPFSALIGWKHADTAFKAVGVPAMLAGGALYGGYGTVIKRAQERTQMDTNRGMAPNNLGTDGLTLALSKRRHR